MIYAIGITICLTLAAVFNQWGRMKRLEWASDTSAFYQGFIPLLLYVFMLGIMFSYFMRKMLEVVQ